MTSSGNSAVDQAFGEAIAHFAAGRLAETDAAVRAILQVDPTHVQSIRLLAQVARFARQPETAVSILREALRVAPQSAETHHEMGAILFSMNHVGEAIESYKRALALKPDFAACLSDLGETEFHCGRPEEAIRLIERAMLLDGKDAGLHERYLRAVRFEAERYPRMVFEHHKRWGELYADPLAKEIRPHGNDRTPERRLRIAYVSGDLFSHSVSFFVDKIFSFHDPAEFTVFVYADVRVKDGFTDRLQAMSPHWQEITGRTDAQVAEMIRKDEIDILVDLAGHSPWNRLGLFAIKPAPVQATYLGYPDTTGVKAIDYRITDEWCDPVGESERFHTEKLLRVPAPFVCFRSLKATPEVSAVPAASGKPITFGSFNILSKLNPELIGLWSRVLQAVPKSRLMLKGWMLGDTSTANRLREAFARHGVEPEQLILLPHEADVLMHLRRYHEIDIALDAYPYHGTTTTCEALWMGLPVVTLAGKTHAARVGVSLLNAVGHPEWIAQDAEAYVKLAAGLARDVAGLSKIRSELREQMRASTLMDAPRFVRGLENGYREMWRNWCASA